MKMYKVCWHCKKSYIEQDEELCVDCAVFISDENEDMYNMLDDIILSDMDGETLNDLGASLSEQK